ncbi:MAG: LysR family transcriptional regulator [Candidatus Frackibacter sp. T328-2]|nr:MAG: LysR family transcriptional regulator [Candidatus Frackibacter sp. T328-2]
MNLRQLKIFMKVCEIGSMSGAAKELYMTQPAISQTIIELEENLEVKLFERIKKKLILTHPGRILLNYSRRILILTEEAENTITDIAKMNQGRLRIGASMTIGTYLLPEIIKDFQTKYQNIELPFIIDNTSVIEEMILNNKIDLALVEGPIKNTEITIKPFFDDQMIIICSPQHKWAKKELIEPSEIEEEEFITREKGSGTREVIENTLAKFNLSYQPKYILNNIEAIKKSVEANIGISILPEIAVKKEIEEDKIIKVSIEKIDFTRKFQLIYHRDKYHSNLFNEFVNHMFS